MYYKHGDIRVNLKMAMYYKRIHECIYVQFAPGVAERLVYNFDSEAEEAIKEMDKIASKLK